MEYRITITTPGSILSTETLMSVLSTLRKDFENGIIAALLEEFPEQGRDKIRRTIKGHISFNFEDMRRGSWIIVLGGTLGGYLLRLAGDMSKDTVLKHPTWEAFKSWLYTKTSKKTAQKVKEKIDHTRKMGPLLVEKSSVNIENTKDGDTLIDVNIRLIRKKDTNSITTAAELTEALERFYQDLAGKSNKQ